MSDWIEDQYLDACGRPGGIPRCADSKVVPTPEYSPGDVAFKPIAPEILRAGIKHMEDRARTYDCPAGERSMSKTVAAFNAVTGADLSETDGWLFMTLLKAVRSQQGAYRADNFEDLVSYGALMGESAAKEVR